MTKREKIYISLIIVSVLLLIGGIYFTIQNLDYYGFFNYKYDIRKFEEAYEYDIRFEKYVGNPTGSIVMSLVNTLIDSANEFPNEPEKVPALTFLDEETIKYDSPSEEARQDYISKLSSIKTNFLKNNIKTTYTLSLEYNYKNGYIKTIIISPKKTNK